MTPAICQAHIGSTKQRGTRRRVALGPTFLGMFVIFALMAGLGCLTVYLRFLTRDLQVERVALQKRYEVLLRKAQQLESQLRSLADQPQMCERAKREFGLLEANLRGCPVAVIPRTMMEKYQGATSSIEMVAAAPAHGMARWQKVFDQLALVTKVSAASEAQSVMPREIRSDKGGVE